MLVGDINEYGALLQANVASRSVHELMLWNIGKVSKQNFRIDSVSLSQTLAKNETAFANRRLTVENKSKKK